VPSGICQAIGGRREDRRGSSAAARGKKGSMAQSSPAMGRRKAEGGGGKRGKRTRVLLVYSPTRRGEGEGGKGGEKGGNSYLISEAFQRMGPFAFSMCLEEDQRKERHIRDLSCLRMRGKKGKKGGHLSPLFEYQRERTLVTCVAYTLLGIIEEREEEKRDIYPHDTQNGSVMKKRRAVNLYSFKEGSWPGGLVPACAKKKNRRGKGASP